MIASDEDFIFSEVTVDADRVSVGTNDSQPSEPF
jgi:hypothetical protein